MPALSGVAHLFLDRRAVAIPAAGLAVVAWAYATGSRRLARRARPAAGRHVAFGLGMTVLTAALVWPLGARAHRSLTAHMVQHVLLVAVAPLPLVWARPWEPLLRAVPQRVRRWHARARRSRSVRGLRSVLAAPLPVGTAYAVVLWGWHLPVLYEAALARDAVHAAEHVTLLVVGVLFWRIVVASPAERGPGGPLLMLLATSLHSAALGALLAFAPRLWYPAQWAGPGRWSLTALEDQQLAGAIMWIPMGALYLAAVIAMVGRLLADRPLDAGRSPEELTIETSGEAS
jgi:cytochrome c oxidase assembly factor CtaG